MPPLSPKLCTSRHSHAMYESAIAGQLDDHSAWGVRSKPEAEQSKFEGAGSLLTAWLPHLTGSCATNMVLAKLAPCLDAAGATET